MTSTRNS